MEAYTTMKITFENKKVAQEAAEIIKKIMSENVADEYDRKYAEVFIADMKIKKNVVEVNDSCCFDSDGYENNMKDIIKEIAQMLSDESFSFLSSYYSCNCGYEAMVDAEYEDGTIIMKSIEADDMNGCCEECGEFIVHFDNYDPNKTYICPECGEVLTEKDLFPEGLPIWEIKEIKIK